MSSASQDATVARDAVLAPFLLIGGLAVALPGLAAVGLAAVAAPTSLAGPLVLLGAVAPFVLGFLWRPKGALLAFAIYLVFFDTTARYLPGAFSYVDEVCVPCFVLIGLIRWRPLSRDRIAPLRDGAVAAFLVAAIASTLLHAVPLGVWVPELGLVLKGIAFFYVVSWVDHLPEDIRAYGLAIAGVAVVVLAFAALELVAPSAIPALGLNPPFVPREGVPSLKGPFVHPVHFSWFCAVAAALAFSRFAVARGWSSLVLGLGSALAVLLSARRWSLIALVAAIGGGFLLFRAAGRSWREAIRAWAAPAVGTALLVAAFAPQLLGLAGLTLIEYVDPVAPPAAGSPGVGTPGADPDIGDNVHPRVALYLGSFRIARDDFPLGEGLGRYASWMSGVQYSPVYARYGLDTVVGITPDDHPFIADTFWPQIIGETGVIGAVAYLAFLAAIGLAILRSLRSQLTRVNVDPTLGAFAMGAGAVFVLAFVNSLANTMFHHPPEAYLTFGLFGVAGSLAWRQARVRATGRPGAWQRPPT